MTYSRRIQPVYSWTARVNGEPFGDKVFRFEFWSSKEHPGSSQSRTAIKDIVMTKNL